MQNRPTRNWPLLAGGTIVLLLTLVAIFGPALAPRDPLERTLIAEIGGRIRGVPFPPFESWEFPLGSDRYGRDLYSRLLWAVRPTLILVVLVGAIRMLLGLLIGAIAGWSSRGASRILSFIIDSALAIPVLMVALATITAVGIETGLIAFVVGMALTGWAETAQTVRAQTRLIATQPYIQAARALGANGGQILIRHVSRHILPLGAMLLALEIGATLLLASALSFMGYFIGGGVWVIFDGDLIPMANRVSGLPELGQLIGTAELRVSSRPPWEIIFPGLVVLVAILGFMLLGEGLRRRQGLAPSANPGPLARLLSGAGGQVEEAMLRAAGRWERQAAAGFYAVSALALAGLVGLIWWQSRPAAAVATPVGLGLPAAAGWPSERGDPYGSLRATAGPAQPALAWEARNEAGFSGGPAVGPDGTVYLASNDSQLNAFGPDGAALWSAPLEHEPIGSPAIGADGTIYVADRRGGLSAFGADGAQRWRFASSYRSEGSGGPIVGPDGTIYYTVLDAVQAVTPDGQARWLGRDPELPYLEMSPRLSPDGSLVFLKNSAFSTADGSRQVITVVPEEQVFADPTFIVGADGRNYYRSGHSLIPWRRVEAGVAVQAPLSWSATNVFFLPADVGVTTQGLAWMLYSTGYADTRLIWISPEGQVLGERFLSLRAGRVIAAADDGSLTLCGVARDSTLSCGEFAPASDEPRWEVKLGIRGAMAQGGALLDGRLYVVSERGGLFVLE